MAIFQNALNFFLPSQRRGRRAARGGGAPTDAATERLLEGVNGVIEPFNAPDHLTEYLEDDLRKAFEIEGPRRSVYEPGRVTPIKFNLLDFATDPLTTTWETVKKPLEPDFSELLYTPDDFASDVDKAVWDHLFKNVWLDPAGGEVLPFTLQYTVDLWRGTTGKGIPKIVREGAARAVRDDPGMIRALSHRIEMHYMAEFGRTSDPKLWEESRRFRALGAEARRFEGKIGTSLRNAKRLKEAGDSLAKAGKFDRAREAWSKADDQWIKAEADGKIWRDKENKHLKGVRRDVNGEFKRLSQKGGPLYNSPEAQFLRYFKNRDLHHATLQFLRTYRKDGFWGVAKFYGWKAVTNKVKDYYYASALKKALNAVAEKIGVKKLLGKLADLQTLTKRLRASVGLWLKRGMRRAGTWVIEKLGLGALIARITGAIAGTAVGGPLGTAVGVVIGAVIQFAGEIVLEKLGGVLKIVGYVMAGVIGFFAIFALGITVLIAIVLSNDPFPWEAAAAARQQHVQITVEACDGSTPLGCLVGAYKNPLRVSNGRHEIRWRVKIKNIGSEEITAASFSFSQSQCASLDQSEFNLAPKKQLTVTCTSEFTETDEIVTNTITFDSIEPEVSEQAVGVAVFGSPAAECPSAVVWPTSRGHITQGPRASGSCGETGGWKCTHDTIEAIDIFGVSQGTPALATHTGVVVAAKFKAGGYGYDEAVYGNYVDVNTTCNGRSVTTRYAHLVSISVRDGDVVAPGTRVGGVGKTGMNGGTDVHLHYEFRGGSPEMGLPYLPVSRHKIYQCVSRSDCGVSW